MKIHDSFNYCGTPMLHWDSRYLCHFSTEMAEIWSPGTFFQDVPKNMPNFSKTKSCTKSFITLKVQLIES